jgi:predicted Zn finger-like uncharacterized protein
MASWYSRGAPLHPPTSSHLTPTIPDSCPACRASEIVTTAKSPDSSSYWRCTNCGEIWNESRYQPGRSGGRTWR